MEAIVVQVAVAVFNALGVILPKLPSIIDEIRGSPDLTAGGASALSTISDKLKTDENEVDAVQPLPTPNMRQG